MHRPSFLKNKLPLLEIPERGTTRNKWCRCSEYDHACSFDDILQCTERHLTGTRQDTICESGLKHRVGVYAFFFFRAVDSLATEMENCTRTFKKKVQVMPFLVILCFNWY